MQLAPPTKSPSATNVADSNERSVRCWICSKGGPDESGQPPRQGGCLCDGLQELIGEGGHVHLPCIANMAKQRTDKWDGRDGKEFRRPWRECPNCSSEYQNYEFAVDLATELVTFVGQKYPEDKWMHIKALFLKLSALLRTGGDDLQPKQKEEINQIANVFFSIINQMRAEVSELPKEITLLESDAYNHLGVIALKEDTKESAKTAMSMFEKSRDICKVRRIWYMLRSWTDIVLHKVIRFHIFTNKLLTPLILLINWQPSLELTSDSLRRAEISML